MVRGSQHLHTQEVVLTGFIPSVGQGVAIGARLQPIPAPRALAGQAGLHKVDVHVAALVLDAVRRHALVALEGHQHRPCRAAVWALCCVLSSQSTESKNSRMLDNILHAMSMGRASLPAEHADADKLPHSELAVWLEAWREAQQGIPEGPTVLLTGTLMALP